jgi:mannose-1-phosphate guanylyltransferase/mannose-6-phosphate isomerase
MYPKQLLPLFGKHSLLQETVCRMTAVTDVGPLICVCNDDHRFLVAEQLREIGFEAGNTIILEPFGRNTAPAAAIAALYIAEHFPGALMLILPADHIILDSQAFTEAIDVARSEAASGKLVTFGVVPSAPETGYGYIRASAGSSGAVRLVKEFVEKPTLERAQNYVASGNYFWNSGMFLFRPEMYLAELEVTSPEILTSCRKAHDLARKDLDFIRLDPDSFAASPSDSIDYAVMEKTDKAVVVPMQAGWSDVGAWSALWEVHERDMDGNVKHGDVLLHQVQNSYIHATSRLVAAVGLEDHVIVETADAVLVASKERVQEVKTIVERLRLMEREESLIHRRVYRPWGSYETVDEGERFKVKRITVKPGAALSLQMHHQRAEHWIVVTGKALVTVDERQMLLEENQSVYIPLQARHRLENPGEEPLELIEVQSGTYLGEDDIVRFEDIYGRL